MNPDRELTYRNQIGVAITADAYATSLAIHIRDALDAAPYTPDCRSFTALHDLCDANELIIGNDDQWRIKTDPTRDDYCTFVNTAVGLAERIVWPVDDPAIQLFDRIAGEHPTIPIEPWLGGGVDHDGFVMSWGDGYLVATSDDEDGTDLGVYTADAWENGGRFVIAIGLTNDDVSGLVAYIVDAIPDDVDPIAWAQQRLVDGIHLNDPDRDIFGDHART